MLAQKQAQTRSLPLKESESCNLAPKLAKSRPGVTPPTTFTISKRTLSAPREPVSPTLKLQEFTYCRAVTTNGWTRLCTGAVSSIRPPREITLKRRPWKCKPRMARNDWSETLRPLKTTSIRRRPSTIISWTTNEPSLRKEWKRDGLPLLSKETTLKPLCQIQTICSWRVWSQLARSLSKNMLSNEPTLNLSNIKV